MLAWFYSNFVNIEVWKKIVFSDRYFLFCETIAIHHVDFLKYLTSENDHS